MRRLTTLFTVLIFTGFMLAACSDSGTGPDNENNGDNGEGETTTYSISVDMTPSDAGTVSPAAEDTYEEGKEIQLLASPGEDYVFAGWTGDMEGDVNPLPLTVSQDFNITANFELKNYDLSITTEGEGSVQENVLEQQSKEYEHGTAVELIANPAEGYTFVEWTGDVEGSDNPAEITVEDPKEVTAVFEKKSYELAVTTQGSGAVSEQVVSKAKDYEYGDVVELSPSPAEGWAFVEWNGDLTGSDNPAQITVDTAKAVTAVFERKTFAVDIATQGEGSIAKDPDQAEYEYGDKLTLTANPDDAWDFKEWAGEISGTTPEISVTVHSERDVTAVFEEEPLFYLAKNGYTVVCPEAAPGQKGYLNGDPSGKVYKAVDRETLEQMIDNNEDVTSVCTTPISDMSELLIDKQNFDQDISNWDVSSVTDMRQMFRAADAFNQDIGDWDVSGVTDMALMFDDADAFNGNISDWDVSGVDDMQYMFANADVFNQDISDWDVSSVEDMGHMFYFAGSFNGDISDWDVSGVINMNRMFYSADVFNQDISNWDVSSVEDMGHMFYYADAFNQDLSDWNTSAVTNMESMFEVASSFNQDLSGWAVPYICSEPDNFDDGADNIVHPNWPEDCETP